MKRRALVLALLCAGSACARYELDGDFAGDDVTSPTPSPTLTVTPTPTPTPLCDASDPALFACYGFEGTTADGSSSGLDLTATAVAYGSGTDGQAVLLSGTSGLAVADDPAFTIVNVTAEVWIHPVALPAAGGRFGILDKDASFGMFLLDTGTIRCTAGGALVVFGPVAVGEWTHAVCEYDNGTLRVFVAGIAGPTATGAALVVNTNPFHVGENSPDGLDQFPGSLDRMRLWNVVRTPEEICAEAGTC